MKLLRVTSLVMCATLALACSAQDPGEAVAQSSAALVSNDQILGFEVLSAWSTSAGRLALSANHVEGASSLAVSGLGSATANVRSVPLSSFSGFTNQISFQISLPTLQPNPSWYGNVELYIDAPSRGVNSQLIVHKELTGMPLGSFQNVTATVPSWIVTALGSGPVSDLSFRFAFTVPAGSQTYLLDALHFVGAGPRTQQFDVFSGGGYPPDPNISVSPSLVGTMSQLHVNFYRKDGSFDHEFLVPTDRQGVSPCCDSKIVWDKQSSRWFLSVLVTFPNGGSGAEFFVSTDATGTNFVSSLPVQEPIFYDNPNITVAADKVVVAADHCLWVVPKSGLLAANAPRVDATTCGIQNGDQIYGVQYGTSVTSTAYLVAFVDDTHVNWISVTGTPAQNNVVVSQHVLAVPALAPQNTVIQQGGTSLESGGVLGMWQNNHLWWSRTEGCGSVDCPRMFDIDTSANSVSSFDFSLSNTYLWSAVPGIDSSGNMWALMSEVSTSTAPGLALGGKTVNGQIFQASIITTGVAPFGGDRWGDYFGSAQDPTDGSVWLIGEYAGSDNYRNRVVHVQYP